MTDLDETTDDLMGRAVARIHELEATVREIGVRATDAEGTVKALRGNLEGAERATVEALERERKALAAARKLQADLDTALESGLDVPVPPPTGLEPVLSATIHVARDEALALPVDEWRPEVEKRAWYAVNELLGSMRVWVPEPEPEEPGPVGGAPPYWWPHVQVGGAPVVSVEVKPGESVAKALRDARASRDAVLVAVLPSSSDVYDCRMAVGTGSRWAADYLNEDVYDRPGLFVVAAEAPESVEVRGRKVPLPRAIVNGQIRVHAARAGMSLGLIGVTQLHDGHGGKTSQVLINPKTPTRWVEYGTRLIEADESAADLKWSRQLYQVSLAVEWRFVDLPSIKEHLDYEHGKGREAQRVARQTVVGVGGQVFQATMRSEEVPFRGPVGIVFDDCWAEGFHRDAGRAGAAYTFAAFMDDLRMVECVTLDDVPGDARGGDGVTNYGALTVWDEGGRGYLDPDGFSGMVSVDIDEDCFFGIRGGNRYVVSIESTRDVVFHADVRSTNGRGLELATSGPPAQRSMVAREPAGAGSQAVKALLGPEWGAYKVAPAFVGPERRYVDPTVQVIEERA